MTPILAAAPLGSAAYTGPPPLTTSTALSSWTWDWTAAVLVAALAVAYLVGIWSVRRSGGRWPLLPTALFGLGLACVVVATMSFLGVYAHVLLWTYAAQVVSLLLVAPVFLALGRPLGLARAADRTGRLRRVWHSGSTRVLGYPPFATAVVAVVPLVFFFTGWFEASLRHQPVYGLTHVVLVAAGFGFFWSNLAVDPLPRGFPLPAATLLVFVETVVDALPGMILWLKATPIAAGYYLSVHRPWGRSVLADQKLAGQLYWAIGELVGLPILLIVAVQWMRADEREARKVDRALDLSVPLGPEGEDEEPLLQTPWWVTDPSRLGRPLHGAPTADRSGAGDDGAP